VNAIERSLFSSQIRHCAEQLKRGQTSLALGRLYDLSAARLVRYACTLTRNQHDAEDALQAAMVRLTLYPQGLAEAWHPWAYFLKVVRNEALKIIRRRKFAQFFVGWSNLGADDPLNLEEDDTRRLVQAALQQLPPAQAEVIVLKIWEQMTFEEIGEVLGESINTVASRYRYALQRLSRVLQPLAPEVWNE